MKEFEVAIIGASVSGASLAARLGKEGVTTAIVDKDYFPRCKACDFSEPKSRLLRVLQFQVLRFWRGLWSCFCTAIQK